MNSRLRDIVEVRRTKETFQTLDDHAKLSFQLFTPRMPNSSGMGFRVCQRAHKNGRLVHKWRIHRLRSR